MDKKQLRAQQPFSTSNAILAFCLRIAGVPPADQNRPCFNLYDVEILKRLGYTGKTIEDGARQAMTEGKKGHVEYQFQRTKQLGALCKAFAAQEAEITADGPEIDVAEFMRGIMEKLDGGQMTPAEGLVRIGCVVLKLRGAFLNAWKNVDPVIRIDNPGKALTRPNGNGERVVVHPGFKIISLNASQERKEHLGV